MLNVNSYNVKYRVFVCVAHKLIPFHKTRRSQSPPGARPHAGTSSHGSGQRPIRCPLHTTAASPRLALPCRARPCRAAPCLAQPCWWKATSRNRDIPGSLDSLAMPSRAPPCPAMPCWVWNQTTPSLPPQTFRTRRETCRNQWLCRLQ